MREQTVQTPTEGRNTEPAEQSRSDERTITPPVDIFEIDNGLAVVADLPGVAKEDVEVRVENDLLTIRGTVKKEEEAEPVYREYGLATYFRQFQLSEEVDQEKIEAEMKYGVLTIRLPRVQKAQPRRIAISSTGE